MRRREFISLIGGVAAAWPVTTYAQQSGRIYRIGLLSPGGFAPSTSPGALTDQMAQHLAQNGLTPGVNVEFVKRGAEGHFEHLSDLVAELLASKVDVIVTFSYPVAAKAKEGARQTPIVIFNAGDPVKTHLVVSLSRPGGNITGISDVAAELAPKRLQFLKQAAPHLQRVAMLWNAEDLGMTLRYEASAAVANELGVTVQSLGVREPNDFDAAFAAMERSMPDGLLMVADALTFLNRKRVFEFAAQHSLPAIYESEPFVRDGGLMSYGPDDDETAERGASLIIRILKGERPADLPLEQPTRFRLVINLKTAKVLRLAVPPTLIGIADEVIE